MMPTNFELIERFSIGLQLAARFLQTYPACQDNNFGMILPNSEPQFLIYSGGTDKREKARNLFGSDGWAKAPNILSSHYDYTKTVDGVLVVVKSAEPIIKTEAPATATL